MATTAVHDHLTTSLRSSELILEQAGPDSKQRLNNPNTKHNGDMKIGPISWGGLFQEETCVRTLGAIFC